MRIMSERPPVASMLARQQRHGPAEPVRPPDRESSRRDLQRHAQGENRQCRGCSTTRRKPVAMGRKGGTPGPSRRSDDAGRKRDLSDQRRVDRCGDDHGREQRRPEDGVEHAERAPNMPDDEVGQGPVRGSHPHRHTSRSLMHDRRRSAGSGCCTVTMRNEDAGQRRPVGHGGMDISPDREYLSGPSNAGCHDPGGRDARG
jgi:hypothetical protein